MEFGPVGIEQASGEILQRFAQIGHHRIGRHRVLFPTASSQRRVWFNDHIEEDGETVFRHACKLGLEGIVSKRKGSPYRSGRSPDRLKSKNPACEAVRREEEEDWGR